MPPWNSPNSAEITYSDTRPSNGRNSSSARPCRTEAPILLFLEYLGKPEVWLSGIGAGNSTEVNTMLLPVVKLTLEYGVIAAIIFSALMLLSLCKDAYRGAIPLALLIFFNLLGGGLAVPFYGLTTILLGTLQQHQRPTLQHDAPVQQHANADEKQAQQHIVKRPDIGFNLVLEFGL